MKLRRLNNTGLARFEEYITNQRGGTESNIPYYLLDSEEFSESVDLIVDVDRDRNFDTRYQMGTYLIELFKNVDIQKYIGDSGFWSWFALLWFEQLCPKRQGKLSPSKPYNYILSHNYNHRPRHAIYITWQLVNRYGEDARFMLCKEPSTRGELTEQLMARQEILSSEAAIRLASSLYFDFEAGTFKRGSASRKRAGCVSRYISWLQQLQLTFDIFSMTKKELEDLLPGEFDGFRTSANSKVSP